VKKVNSSDTRYGKGEPIKKPVKLASRKGDRRVVRRAKENGEKLAVKKKKKNGRQEMKPRHGKGTLTDPTVGEGPRRVDKRIRLLNRSKGVRNKGFVPLQQNRGAEEERADTLIRGNETRVPKNGYSSQGHGNLAFWGKEGGSCPKKLLGKGDRTKTTNLQGEEGRHLQNTVVLKKRGRKKKKKIGAEGNCYYAVEL